MFSLGKSGSSSRTRCFLLDVRQDQNALARDQSIEPRDRFLEQRAIGNELEQLLRTRLAG